MRIRVAILEKDLSYLDRLSSALGTKYGDKTEIYSFTSPEKAQMSLSESRIDVFLASDLFSGIFNKVPEHCGTAYLVDSPSIETVEGYPAVCRFQKVDLIYKHILDVYAETTRSIVEKSSGNASSNTRILCFSSPAGGTGTSSVAAACALHLAKQNHRVLYLNVEYLGSSDEYFSADGTFTMSDVIYAVKRGKANLSIKLESCVKRDPRGVFFFSQPKIALDMMELHVSEILQMVRELQSSSNYDDIILDMDFSMEEEKLKVFSEASALIWVSDGSTTANRKLLRALDSLFVKETALNISLTRKINLIYNRFSNKNGVTLPEGSLKALGGAPRFEHASTAQVLAKLADKDFFDAIG